MIDKQDVIKFVTDNMGWIGFGNYLVAIKEVKKLDSLAIIEVSEVGQHILLTLPLSFYDKTDYEQTNVLLHELIHGRESLRQQRIEEYTKDIKDSEEEKCVNDITSLAQRWE